MSASTRLSPLGISQAANASYAGKSQPSLADSPGPVRATASNARITASATQARIRAAAGLGSIRITDAQGNG